MVYYNSISNPISESISVCFFSVSHLSFPENTIKISSFEIDAAVPSAVRKVFCEHYTSTY